MTASAAPSFDPLALLAPGAASPVRAHSGAGRGVGEAGAAGDAGPAVPFAGLLAALPVPPAGAARVQDLPPGGRFLPLARGAGLAQDAALAAALGRAAGAAHPAREGVPGEAPDALAQRLADGMAARLAALSGGRALPQGAAAQMPASPAPDGNVAIPRATPEAAGVDRLFAARNGAMPAAPADTGIIGVEPRLGIIGVEPRLRDGGETTYGRHGNRGSTPIITPIIPASTQGIAGDAALDAVQARKPGVALAADALVRAVDDAASAAPERAAGAPSGTRDAPSTLAPITLGDTARTAPAPGTGTSADAAGDMQQRFGEALAQRVEYMVDHKLGQARLRLNPPELGALEIKLSLVDERAHVQFHASQPAAREALETALPRLRELLASSGLELGSASVDGGGAGAERGPTDTPEAVPIDAPAVLPELLTAPRAPRAPAGAVDVYA